MSLRRVHAFVLLCAGVLTPAVDSFAQNETTPDYFGYSKQLQRVHLKFVSAYVFFRMRRNMDADSAAILAAEGERLPYSFYYDGDYADGPEGRIKKLLSEGNSYVFRSGTEPTDLDRALSILTQAKDEAMKEKNTYFQHAALASLGRCYSQLKDQEASSRCFDDAVDLARQANNPPMLTRALANRGSNFQFGNPQKELDFQESLNLALQQKDTVSEIDIRTLIYQIYFVQRKWDTVVMQLNHVTELEKAIGYKHLHYNYNVLSFLNSFNDVTQVFADNRAAVNSMEATGDYAFSNFIYGSMAEFYIDFKNFDRATEWLFKSIEQEHLNKAKMLWYIQFNLIVENMAKRGRPKEALKILLDVTREYPPVLAAHKMHVAHNLGYCYYRFNQRDSSKKYYDIMLSYLEPRHEELTDTEMYVGYLDLSRYHLEGGRVNLAKHYFSKSRSFYTGNDVFSEAAIHKFQFRLDSADGNYFKALKEYQAAQALSDSVYSLEKNMQLTEAQIHYDVEAKDKDIELLVQKDKVQQATLERSTLEKRFTLAGILVMFVITGLIYRQYLNKQKRNKEIGEKNEALARLVTDKEWLVKEIHHRVKNNLQIIISLLRTQAAHLTEGEALAAIHESQSRMQVISLLHQKLYKGETNSSIDMKMYVPELVNCIREGIDADSRINYDVDVDNIELDISQAVPVGLIFNEAITNAIKYAYPDGQRGNVRVSLKSKADDKLVLSVVDNGRGLPQGFDYRQVTSMGMKLIETLAEQLEGTMELFSDRGTTLEIRFARTDSNR